MKTITRYTCEICGVEYDDTELARACEALGLPDPVPWLPWDREIPAFGESGIKYGRLRGVEIRNSWNCTPHINYFKQGAVKHVWWLDTQPYVYVSHNMPADERMTPLGAFDPREGYDAFRYGDVSKKDLEVWATTMKTYSFAEGDVRKHMHDRIEAARTKWIRYDLAGTDFEFENSR